jgi:hypothetical protein
VGEDHVGDAGGKVLSGFRGAGPDDGASLWRSGDVKRTGDPQGPATMVEPVKHHDSGTGRTGG